MRGDATRFSGGSSGTGFSWPSDDAPTMASMPTMGVGAEGADAAVGFVDQYALVRKLGGGGFGVVYLARDTAGGVDVALKTLHPLLKRNAEEMEKLREKFRLVSRLAHPSIATALVLHPVKSVSISDPDAARELGLSPGDHVMVMRYAPGVTLSQWRRQFGSAPVPPDAVSEVARQLASALDYAHGEKIVHRDVKPSNVMVETLDAASLRVRVLDFGLAAEIRSSMSRVSNETGDTSGTRPYMAPEQWSGLPQDGRTDQYALACVVYELLCGAPPFAGVFETGDPAIMRSAVQSEPPRPVPGLSRAANAALLRALAKRPDDRFPSCTAFVEALAAGLSRGSFPIPGAGLGRLFSSERSSSRRNPPSAPSHSSVPSSPSVSDRGKWFPRIFFAFAAVAVVIGAVLFVGSGGGNSDTPNLDPNSGPTNTIHELKAMEARKAEVGKVRQYIDTVLGETAGFTSWDEESYASRRKTVADAERRIASLGFTPDDVAEARRLEDGVVQARAWMVKNAPRRREAAAASRAFDEAQAAFDGSPAAAAVSDGDLDAVHSRRREAAADFSAGRYDSAASRFAEAKSALADADRVIASRLARRDGIAKDVSAETAKLSGVERWDDAEWNDHQKRFREAKAAALASPATKAGLAAAETALESVKEEVRWLLGGDKGRRTAAEAKKAAEKARLAAEAERQNRLRRIADAKTSGKVSSGNITASFRSYGDKAFVSHVKAADEAARGLSAIPDNDDSRVEEAETAARRVASEVKWMEERADDRAKLEGAKREWTTLLGAGRDLEIREFAPDLCAEADASLSKSAAFEAEGKYAESRVALASALGTLRACVDGVKKRRAAAATRLSREFAAAGKWTEAAEAAARALSFDPESAEAKSLASEADRMLHPNRGAVRIVRVADRSDPAKFVSVEFEWIESGREPGGGFWRTKTPVSQAFWLAVGKAPQRFFPKGPEHPANNVNASDVATWLDALHAREECAGWTFSPIWNVAKDLASESLNARDPKNTFHLKGVWKQK